MNFNFTEEQLMIQQAARDFAERELLPDVIDRDTNATFPHRQMKLLAELGFFGITVSPEYGGSGMDSISYVLALEEIAKIDAAAAVVLAVHNSLTCYGIEHFANEEQKRKFLPDLASGKKIGAFLLSEAEAGSDATSLKTIAEDKGDHYLLNGTKIWITSADNAGIYIVVAHTHPELKHRGINAFIVDRHSPGITLGPHENKMGMRSSDTHPVMFTDVKVPKENRIGDDGFGFKFAMKVLDAGRMGIAAQAMGIAGGAFDLAVKYSKERKTFGTEIANHQAIAFKLADMAVKLENGRNLVYKSAWQKDNGINFSVMSAMAKQYCADVAMEITTEAVQIHGGYGYVKEYHVERLMREAKLTQIYEGTSEIQKIIISRAILKE
ncbi:MAG: acyl-CoA dehydrogenase family protein [Bacteroidales bacterium]